MKTSDYKTTVRQIFSFLCHHGPVQPATNYWRAFELAQVIAHGLPHGRGLDVGCGDGLIMELICQLTGAKRITGIDIDPYETSLAAQRGVYEEVYTGSAAEVPEQDSSFDYAFSNSVLEHIPPIQEVLNEIARVLKPQGLFIFTVPNENFHANLAGPHRIWKDRTRYSALVDERCAHLRYWSINEWRQALNKAGMDIVHSNGYLNRTNLQRWENIARYTSGILYSLTANNKQPIELQRSLRLRSTNPTATKKLLTIVMEKLLFANPMDTGPSQELSCHLIVAQKRATSQPTSE